MAKQQPNTSLDKTRTFVKGLTRDADPSFIQDGKCFFLDVGGRGDA